MRHVDREWLCLHFWFSLGCSDGLIVGGWLVCERMKGRPLSIMSSLFRLSF